MSHLYLLQPLTPVLSAVLAAVLADIVLRLVPQARDRVDPLLGFPVRMAAGLARRLNRRERTRDVRFNRGVITLFLMILTGIVLAGAAYLVVRMQPSLELVIWFLCLHLTFPWTAAVDVLKIWSHKDKEAVAQGLEILKRRRVPVLVPAVHPDRHAVARMLIEAMATSLHRGLLAPLLWAMAAKLAGYPALPVAIMVVTLLEAERAIVTQGTKDEPFAQSFEFIEAIINFIPARVAALFWVLGAVFTPGAHPVTALRAMFVQSAAHRAVNSGWPVAAVAGALGVALPGGKKRDLWVGADKATARADAGDIRRGLFLHIVTVALTILVFTAMLLLSLAA